MNSTIESFFHKFNQANQRSCHESVVGGRPLREIDGGWDRQEPNRPEETVGDEWVVGVGGGKDNIRVLFQHFNVLG